MWSEFRENSVGGSAKNYDTTSDVVANWKLPRLFFAMEALMIQRLQVWYAPEYKVPNEGGKVKAWRGFVSRY